MTALTKREQQALEKKANQLDQGIRQCVRQTRQLWPALAALLFEFGEERAWEILGYDTLEAYLADPDVEIERRTYFRLTRAHRVLVLDGEVSAEQLAEIPPSRIHEIVPAVESGKLKVDDALSKATGLAVSDLREHIKDPDAPIDPERERKKCPTCGSRVSPEKLDGKS